MTAFAGATFFLSKTEGGPDSVPEAQTPRPDWRRTSENENEPLFPPEHHTCQASQPSRCQLVRFREDWKTISLMGLAAANRRLCQ